MLAWLINHNFSLDYVPLLSLAIIFLIQFWAWIIGKKEQVTYPKVKKISLTDTLSIVVSLLIIAIVIIAPTYQNDKGSKPPITISMINGNVDDSSHLGLVNDSLQFNRGILFGSDSADKSRNDGFYPAGWQSASAIIIKTFCPNIQTGITSLLAYGVLKFFWLFILFYLIIKISFILYVFITGQRLKLNAYFSILTITSLLGCIFLLPMAREGFYSLLPQLITAILSVPIVIQLCVSKNYLERRQILPILLFVFIGGCLAWLLPLPAFVLAASILLLIISFDKQLSKTLKNIFIIAKENLLILLTLSVSLIVQIFVMSSNKTEKSVSFFEGIALDGGITKYNSIFYMLVCIGFLACILFINKKSKKTFYLILSLLMSILLYCTFIHLVQMKMLGRDAYYYFKLLNILTIMVLPFCVVGLGLIIKKLCGKNQKLIEILITTIFISVTFIAVGPEISTLAYAGGHRDFPAQVSNSLHHELSNNIAEKNYFNKRYLFYYIPDSEYYVQSEVANMTAKSMKPNSSCFENTRKATWDLPPIRKLLNEIKIHCKDYKIDLITDEKNYADFTKAVIDTNLKDVITIKTY